ncbi:acyl-CoA thioesterase [soil metagenome]
MKREPELFEQTILVQESDLDELRHVNNVRYVQWMEDIAKSHWEQRAPAEVKAKYIWMVIRHEIDYKSQAFLDDEILLQTHVGEHTLVTSQRHVIIRNKTTQKIIIQAKSTWCLLNAKTHKPAKISEEIFEDFYKK